MTRLPCLVSVVGARPQFVKLAPLCRAIERRHRSGAGAVRHVIVHTGQHYDSAMSDVFFEDLDIPRPSVNLGVGSGPHGRQTGLMLASLEAFLAGGEPDAVIVFGDTNTTLAAALAAAKRNIPVAHVEAGLRSFNRGMPEEVNRVAVDHLSDLLFAPTAQAVANLEREGLAERTVRSGDVMLEAVEFGRKRAAERSTILDRLDMNGRPFALATLHRAENVDGARLGELLAAFDRVAECGLDILLPLHPRTRNRLRKGALLGKAAAGVRIIDPVRYLDMVRLLEASTMVLTDSGGLQKEAFMLRRPCVTLRDETEWVETVEAGGNVLAGTGPDAIVTAVRAWNERLGNGWEPGDAADEMFGPAGAADRILEAILRSGAR